MPLDVSQLEVSNFRLRCEIDQHIYVTLVRLRAPHVGTEYGYRLDVLRMRALPNRLRQRLFQFLFAHTLYHTDIMKIVNRSSLGSALNRKSSQSVFGCSLRSPFGKEPGAAAVGGK